MTRFDVFNGDADGLCAVQQLRLAEPRDAVVVTGRKREIALLERVAAAPGDLVTVLDVSMAANRAALQRLLAGGVHVVYFDHHAPGENVVHVNLRAYLDTSADTCTSLIVDRWLGGTQRRWAIVGAYGDGLVDEADRLAAALDADARGTLREIGADLNYNAYGDRDEDLVVAPADLHRHLRGVADPLLLRDDATIARIRAARFADAARAREQPLIPAGPGSLACMLPDADWSRRIRGTLAHDLAQRHPGHATAVLVPDAAGGFVVSVRAPGMRRTGADALCRRFGGDGRVGAAGIPHLPAARLDEFLAALAAAYAPSVK